MNPKNDCFYLAIFMALGAGVGAAFQQIPVGICFGAAIGAILDCKKKK